MSEDLLIQHCSPTLAGIKTGNMFTCSFDSEDEMKEEIRHLNRTLGKKGIRVISLRYTNKRALIYMFRPSYLSRDLKDKTAEKILCERGYCPENAGKCIVHLMKRIAKHKEFPHEIGLFLGYPPEDVCGFIDNKGCCKCVGCWKVYGDVKAARKKFEKYRKCRNAYSEQYIKGRSIELLTVAV